LTLSRLRRIVRSRTRWCVATSWENQSVITVPTSDSCNDQVGRLAWEEPACPLCGSRSGVPFIEAPDPTGGRNALWFAVVRCANCRLCYTSPRPTRESIGQFYSQTYPPHRGVRQTRALRSWYPLAMLSGRSTERRRLPVQGQGRLLDFGCGNGSFLLRMAQQGWQVMGLDMSAQAVERIKAELRLPALQGTLPHPELTPGSFEVVTMWHSLEHVHDPLDTLRQVHRLLTPGGRLFVAVPNIDSWPFRLFGQSWFGLDLPRHLTHFCPATLRAMLVRAGFGVESLRMIRHSDWLRSSARLAARSRPLAWSTLLTFKPFARVVSWLGFMLGNSDAMLAVARRA
jgi:2-polyprenyl-3-methyl-5-hydroxy-6-metoxy-1,4-benzoquinol methylase